ncbi:hypothetical protein [Spiroplasma sp. DGKH1]|uniref:hypothetical protein n=1 Tax=Spiroplasma sp. DGKH1 TaxID=3050074 RepID=UPI0034C6BD2E
MENANFKTKKKKSTFVGGQYLFLLIFWAIFTAVLIVMLVLFLKERTDINEKNNVNQILTEIKTGTLTDAEIQERYHQLMSISYPLIDFSLMSFNFFGKGNNDVTDWAKAWDQRTVNINMAYSYIFITAVIALIGLCFYITIIIKLYKRRAFEWRYNLITTFPNDYVIFNTRIYLNFVTSLTIVFSFFNFLTTLISLAYGIVLVLVSYFLWYVVGKKTEVLVPHKWWTATNFAFFVTVLLIQNIYTLIKSIFADKFGVDLDLIIQIIFPIGTITVIIAVAIKNMLSTKVTAVRNAVKTIAGKVASFRIFYYSQKEGALEDYTFVSQLPPLVKGPLGAEKISNDEALTLMTIVDDTAKFFEQHFTNPKERNYMLYHLFNEITSVEEINEIKENVLKVEAKKAKK